MWYVDVDLQHVDLQHVDLHGGVASHADQDAGTGFVTLPCMCPRSGLIDVAQQVAAAHFRCLLQPKTLIQSLSRQLG
jgi:hypothetical protein